MAFEVFTDTSGNLPKRLVDEHRIGMIPFFYHMDGKDHVCVDIEAFDGERFYRDMKGGKIVTTTQISPQQYADAFEPALREGKDLIFVSMSSGVSGSYNSSLIAADMLRESYPERRVYSIDTRGAALGEGLVALEAARCRDEGLSLEAAVERLETFSRRMCNVFTVDDLMFLKRGGRLSNLSAIVGTVLNIKPLLKGDVDGKIVAFAKLRGRKRAVEALAEKYEALVVEPEKQTIGIVNAACQADADRLIALICAHRPPKEIVQACYEPVTGCHVGPGALALFFQGADDVRTELDTAGATGGKLGDLIHEVKERAADTIQRVKKD
ncbi:MAG: DegV family protein [Oscillospiraceae bacterium]|nr:DegV family protein [Oscillospiraceae bacterium]